jgi:hypothetical protein
MAVRPSPGLSTPPLYERQPSYNSGQLAGHMYQEGAKQQAASKMAAAGEGLLIGSIAFL